MSFPWLHPKRATLPDRRDAVYRREIQDRAALLFRLGFSRGRARDRLRGNVRWDYEVGGRRAPIAEAEIDRIVDEIYRRGGPGAGPPSV